MICKNCIRGENEVTRHEFVTRSMALDAGLSLDMVGTEIDWDTEWIICDCCFGDWEHCERCEREAEE